MNPAFVPAAVLLSGAAAVLIFAAIFILRKRAENFDFQRGRAWVELNMENLRHNAKILQGLLPDGCRLMPAVKADAYGHGAVEVCKALNDAGIGAFCVASVLEGAELRRRHIRGDILVLGYTHPDGFNLLRRYRLTQTVVDRKYAETLNRYGKKVSVHIKIDTGMRRLGEPSENIENILDIFKIKNLDVRGVYTHFSARDGDFTREQTERYRGVLSKIKERGFSPGKTHAQSSYGIFSRPDLTFDYARAGIALYGAYNETAKTAGLRPVLSVKARIGAVKTVSAGENIGYGTAFAARGDMKIAVLGIGYADGIPRSLSNGGGKVLINGAFARVIGHICMDQIIADVTGIENVRQGGIAVIIGRDGENEISVFDAAEWASTVPNEILSRLGKRLPRLKSVT